MANRKLTQLPELTSVANDDFTYVVDVSDTTESPQGTSKKTTRENLTANSIPYTGTTQPIMGFLEFLEDNGFFSTSGFITNSIGFSANGININSGNSDTLERTSIQIDPTFIEINSDTPTFSLRGTLEYFNDGTDRRIYPQTGWVQDAIADSIDGVELQSNKGEPNGYAPLNASATIDLEYFPDAILGQLIHGGMVNCTTMVATLTNNAKTKLGTASATITLTNDTTAITGYVANEGIYYIATTDGTFAGISFLVGDWLISTGSSWQKVDNTDAVASVNGQTGVVNISLQDVSGVSSTTTKGILINETTDIAIEANSISDVAISAYSENSSSAQFNIGASNTNNITEFKKGGTTQASISHDGVLSAKGATLTGSVVVPDATLSTQAVNLGQLNTATQWTKTGDNIRNNNVGDVQLKMHTGKKVSFLRNDNVEVALVDIQGNFGGNYGYFDTVQFNTGKGIQVGGNGANFFRGFIGSRWESDILIKYISDLSANYDARSLIDKGFLDAQLALKANIAGQVFTGAISATNLSGTNTGDENENNVSITHDFFSINSSEDYLITSLNSGTVTTGTPTANNQGVIRISSSTSANSGVVIKGSGLLVRVKGGEVFTYIFNPQTFTNTTSRMGIHDSNSSSDANNGIYFEYSGSGVLTLKTADNGTRTTSASLGTLSTSTWYKVRFTVNANATSVLAQLFDATGTLISSVTQTTNIPTSARALSVATVTTNSGTIASALIEVDYINTKFSLTR